MTSTGGSGELVIRGKRSRIDRLPLPAEVGEALAEYLSRGRPRGFGRTVFLRVQAPLGAMSRRRGQRGGDPCVPPGRDPAGPGAQVASHDRDGDAARRRGPDRDRPGAAPPEP